MLYPKLDYSPVPTQWAVGIDWGRYYILSEGKIYEKEYNALTWQSGMKMYGCVDILPKILFAVINMVIGTINFPEDLKFYYTFPWSGTVFLPLLMLFWYLYISKKEGKFNSFDCFLLIFLSIFPLASAVEPVSGNTNSSGIARVFFFLMVILFIIIFTEKKRNTMILGIFIFLLFPFFYYYHTWSYYFAINLTAIGFFTLFKKNERYITSLTNLGIITFITSAIYYNSLLMEEPIRIYKKFPQLLVNFPSVSFTMKVNPELLGYSPLGSTYSYIQLVNSALIVSICLIFFWKYLSFRKEAKPYENLLFYFLIAQSFIALALFFWDGILGVYARSFEVLIYICMLLSAYLLVKSEEKLKTTIRFILLCAVCLCIISYLTVPHELNRSLTNEEFVGIRFAGTHIPKTSYIFSDFRLGTPLIYFDQLGIITIDAPHRSPQITEETLERCYYNITDPEMILDNIIHKPDYYFITSSHQSEVYLLDPSLKQFKPPSTDFQGEWAKQEAFNKLYSSEYFDIFQRR
jgi:uncharacterized membrane protein YtjA (UPF0391 family)